SHPNPGSTDVSSTIGSADSNSKIASPNPTLTPSCRPMSGFPAGGGSPPVLPPPVLPPPVLPPPVLPPPVLPPPVLPPPVFAALSPALTLLFPTVSVWVVL